MRKFRTKREDWENLGKFQTFYSVELFNISFVLRIRKCEINIGFVSHKIPIEVNTLEIYLTCLWTFKANCIVILKFEKPFYSYYSMNRFCMLWTFFFLQLNGYYFRRRRWWEIKLCQLNFNFRNWRGWGQHPDFPFFSGFCDRVYSFIQFVFRDNSKRNRFWNCNFSSFINFGTSSFCSLLLDTATQCQK